MFREITQVIFGKDSEIARLKRRIAELERPDMFWSADYPETPFSSISELLDYEENLEPVEIDRAVSLPNIWAVMTKNGDDVIVHEFASKEEGARFCKEVMSKENKGDAA